MTLAPQPGSWPDRFADEGALVDGLTRPSRELVEFVRTLTSPLVILGAGGKMGPTLAVLARRAADAAGHQLEVVAVSRFTDTGAQRWLEERGVRTVAADLFDATAVRRLPEAAHVIYLVGLKFGTSRTPELTWAVNTLVPALVAERYRSARLVALSTGNVYPLTDDAGCGSVESAALTPLGEYGNAAVARERIFQFQAGRHGGSIALIRLFYAVELRYGVLVDLARAIHGGRPVPLVTGAFNCIWQGDANEMIIRALGLASSPPAAWNLCCPEVLRVRDIALRLGQALDREPRFDGTESGTALLGDARKITAALGNPRTSVDTMLAWVADWVKSGGRFLDKPTHFEVRDGVY